MCISILKIDIKSQRRLQELDEILNFKFVEFFFVLWSMPAPSMFSCQS
jgi:hypothetical protein